MYLPLAPLAVLVVLANWTGTRRLAELLKTDPRAAPVMTTVAVLAVATALGMTTYLRNEVYRSGVTLWNDVLTKAPGNPRAYSSLAWHVELETGDKPAAIRLNRRALQIYPDIDTAHRGLAVLLYGSNRAESVFHAREAVRIERNADNLNNLGIVIANTAPNEAEQCFREAIALDPRLTAAELNLAKLLTLSGQRPSGRRAEAIDRLGPPASGS
jgi:tetratricopeptide (TPR) repeat protein